MDEKSVGESGTVYVLNTAVVTDYGDYRLEGPISVAQAAELLSRGFVSAVGHVPTAEFLSNLLGITIPANRIRVEMRPGDCALVFRLKERLPEGKVLSADEMKQIPFELAILRRLA